MGEEKNQTCDKKKDSGKWCGGYCEYCSWRDDCEYYLEGRE